MLVSSKGKHTGFTLVELLVVLTITATVGAMVGPDLWSSYQRANERLTVVSFGQELTSIRRDLMKGKQSLSYVEDELAVSSSDSELPTLETGWTVVANSELYFLPNGATNGGNIDFESPTGRTWRLNLAVLDGKIEVELQ